MLEHLRFQPIILSEQEGRIRTIIEGLQRFVDVAFAVVLTPDDVGGVAATRPQFATKTLRRRSGRNWIVGTPDAGV